MAMNRRKVLAALGGITIGGGALFGTGAFDTVEAERDVTVDTAPDSDANIELSVTASSSAALGSPSDNTISIDGTNLNLDGITRINTALTLTVSSNVASGESYTLDVHKSSPTSSSNSITKTSANKNQGGDTMQLIFNNVSGAGTAGGSGGADGVESGDSVEYDILFNTKGTNTADSLDNPHSGSIVVKATKE